MRDLLKVISLTLVVGLAGGVYAPSAYADYTLAYDDAIPDLYLEKKFKYEESIKAHGNYFKEPLLLKEDYITSLDNFERMVDSLLACLPKYAVNDDNDQIMKLKLELMYLHDFKHQIKCLRGNINKLERERDGATYVELRNSMNHKISLDIERNLLEFYRR